jgi:hypothetical protein
MEPSNLRSLHGSMLGRAPCRATPSHALRAGIQAVGFIEVVDGKPTATGKRGCQGFIEWLALNEPKTAAALFARVLPYFINVSGALKPCVQPLGPAGVPVAVGSFAAFHLINLIILASFCQIYNR